MVILGGDYVQSMAEGGTASLKMVFNGCGAVIFAATEQHRDQKAPGLSYEDNYEGNALAAMLSCGKIEVRFHKKLSDSQVIGFLSQLLRQPELALMQSWQCTYQGRVLPSETPRV